jgi:hypothetical protein
VQSNSSGREQSATCLTAMLAKFVGQLDSGPRVLRGWCDPLGAPRPLGPLTDALAGLDAAAGAGLAAAVDSGDTARIYRQLLATLGDRDRWVWMIEDAHWADGTTLDLVRFLARRIATLRLLLVISFRDDELAATHPLAVTLGDLANYAAVSRMALEALSLPAVSALAAGSGVNAERLHQVTGGNPFFVTEVLAAGPDALTRKALPRSISEAVHGRLGRLSAKARETVHAVAVCGPRAHVSLLEKMCPEARTALHECLDAGVLIAEGELVGFRHELARRATVAQIPDFDRIELHRRALTALAQPPNDPNTLAALAFHADEAGESDATIRYGIAAAERAASLGANREAASLYALALRCTDTAADERRVSWLERHAFACYLSGQAEPAVVSLREAITLRRKLGDQLEGFRSPRVDRAPTPGLRPACRRAQQPRDRRRTAHQPQDGWPPRRGDLDQAGRAEPHPCGCLRAATPGRPASEVVSYAVAPAAVPLSPALSTLSRLSASCSSR